MGDPIPLTEEEIDDILCMARANELDELAPYLESLAQKYGCEKTEILNSAVDAESGNTAVHFAGANGHLELTRALLSYFLPPPKPPSQAQAPSSEASASPTPTPKTSTPADIPPALKSYINTTNALGNTCLHFTALNGHLATTQSLIGHGADASILNKAGYDCVFEAERNGKTEVAEWLLREAVGLESGVRGMSRGGEMGMAAQAQGGGDEEDVSFAVRAGDVNGVGEEMDVTEGVAGLDVRATIGTEEGANSNG